METIREFETRLKLIQSRKRVRAQRVYLPGEAAAATPTLQPSPQSGWPVPIIATVLAIAVIAGAFAVAWDDIAVPLPALKEDRTLSLLHSALHDVQAPRRQRVPS